GSTRGSRRRAGGGRRRRNSSSPPPERPSQSRRQSSGSRQNGPSASRDRRVPWEPFRTEPSMRSPAPLLSSADALSQQRPFRRILGKLQRTVERGRDLAFAAELAEQLGSGGMVQVIVLQLV